jgi:Fe-S cluster assembly protein SufD
MNSANDVRLGYHEDFRRLGAALPGAGLPWLREQRAEAFDRFMEQGFPTLKHEDWKYTDARPIAMRRFTPATGEASLDPSALAPYAWGGHQIVFVDGRYAPALSGIGGLPQGVRLLSLAAALDVEPHMLERWLGPEAVAARHGFEALNTAFVRDGAVLRIGRGITIEEPIHLLFLATGAPDSAVYWRNLIVAEAGSRATVIETYASPDGAAHLTNAMTEVGLEANAALEHYRLGRESDTAYHIGGTRARLARDSRYAAHAVTLGARLARHELDAVLDAEGAECLLNGLYATRGQQHVDNHTRIEHRAPRGTSREWYKGVLDERSRAVFSGRIVVHPQAQHTDAEQANHHLLLSREAEADSRPQLEIYANDVKCAHGATAGRLDETALFYLRSRGLDEARARGLLVYAFAADVLARMRFAPLRQSLEQQLAARLLAGEPVQELPT